jgi:hypothetical protein
MVSRVIQTQPSFQNSIKVLHVLLHSIGHVHMGVTSGSAGFG